MKPAPFTYHAPDTVEATIALLARHAPGGGRVIAGGQSFVPMMAFRLASPGHLIDINRVAGLAYLAEDSGKLRIGALVRHVKLESGAAAGRLGALLRAIAPSIAHRPIRNRGTFCGSLAHADPSAEWCLAAATLDGEIVACSQRGTRVIPAARFFLGVMTTALEADELMIECRLPCLSDDARFGFEEVSRRAGDFAMAAALVTYRLDAGRITEPRVGIGGVEHAPRRIPDAEAILAGAAPDAACFRRAAEAAVDAVEPMQDVHTTAAYRRHLVRTVTQRALERSLT